MFRSIFAVLIASTLALVGCRADSQLPADPPAVQDREAVSTEEASTEAAVETIAVTIHMADGASHVFTVETAITSDEQRRGLMFRDSLPQDGGMIFPFEFPRIASFWMRNTMIPLDMIFIRADGVIANIARETEPYTLNSYVSSEPVIAVLEIDGGRAAELGIDAGDRVSWPGGPGSSN